MSIGDYQHLPLDETGNYTQHISNGNGKLKPLLFAEAQLVVLALDLAGSILVTDEFDLCNAKGHLGFHLENPWRHEGDGAASTILVVGDATQKDLRMQRIPRDFHRWSHVFCHFPNSWGLSPWQKEKGNGLATPDLLRR